MNPVNSSVLTGVIVVLGRWSEGKTVEIKTVIAVTILALFLSLMEQGNAKLANGFALLIIIAATMRYAIPITKKLGIS